MLELKGITKCYKTGNSEVFALNNVSISFRNSEFVAILGPSGSGKTTLLNIIGGLDRYDSGDLVINSRSTKQYKDKGFLVAGERIEDTFPFADWGNSALEFTKERVCGNEIVHSTTNGTVAIALAQESNPSKIVIGAFSNISALANYLSEQGKDVQLFCSGWNNTVSLEDMTFAGALADRLLQSGKFENKNDSTHSAIAVWNSAKDDLQGYMENASHIHRLRKHKMDDVFDYTFQLDTCNVVPGLEQKKIINVMQ